MSDQPGSITGPTTWPATSEPPTFDVDDAGHPYWMVEAATTPDLLDDAAAATRSDDCYYLGGDEAGVFSSGSTWLMPQEVWDRLGVHGRIYYRLYTSEIDSGWSDWTVSVADPSVGQVPFVEVGEPSQPPDTTPDPAQSGADVDALCRYLHIDRADFEVEQDRYFARLGELLTFAGVTSWPGEVDASTFREAVRQFQGQQGLGADGIPGEDTLWALNAPWAASRQLALVRVEMDLWTPPGAAAHDENQHGYRAIRVRSDAADAVAGFRADLNAVGVLMTSSGATRGLDAAVSAGRSSTSIHYSAAAVDLATTSGMVRSGAATADNQLYVITEDSGRWRIWSRSDDGEDLDLEAVEWSGGRTSTRAVSGRFFDVTAAAEQRGLRRIGARSTFPAQYLSAEWWHLQCEDVLVPWASQFGGEILSLAVNSEADLQGQPGLWDNRKRIFHRGTNGWW